jgi:hypothetical protein
MFAVIVVVVFMGIDRFRERSATARKEQAESETRRLLAEERRADADRQANERAEQREITKQFNVLIRASKINTHQMGENIGKMATGIEGLVSQMALDRNANANNIDRIIRASDARHKSFEERQTANLEALSERLANEISTTSNSNAEIFARVHRETMLEVAAMNSNEEERIAAATVAALVKHGILNPSTLLSAATGDSKGDTGKLTPPVGDVTVHADTVNVQQNPKGTNDETPNPDPSTTSSIQPPDAGAIAGADA